jgi:hypothetical protein
MTVEPHDATTVSRPALPPRARTLAEYQASIIARFGRMPPWPKLPKLENAARRAGGKINLIPAMDEGSIEGIGRPSNSAIPITVRGETFASLSACARHFGISLPSVLYAIKYGNVDKIGLRKRAK